MKNSLFITFEVRDEFHQTIKQIRTMVPATALEAARVPEDLIKLYACDMYNALRYFA